MALQFAEWTPWGAAFLSEEQGEQGRLGVDYTSNVDTRWERQVMLGPLVTTLSCAAAGGTAANTNGFAVQPATMNATHGLGLYAIRGTKWAKMKITSGTSAITLTSDGSESALAEAATSILYTKNAAGTEEISIGMLDTAYRVITTVGNTTTDTHSANASTAKARIIALAGSSSANRDVALLGKGTGSVHNNVSQNTLSGSVTMATPTLTTRATIGGEAITFTGFAMDQDKWTLGTSNGPYYLDSSFQVFRPLIEELDNDTGQCDQMGVWGVVASSVIIPLKRSTRIARNLSGRSIGPEVYRENTGPVTGSTTAFTSSERWGYFAFYNVVQDKTWIVAARPSLEADWHQYPISYFPIIQLGDGIECHAAQYIGTLGTRTLPMVAIGSDSNVAFFDEGRIDRFTDDTSYTYGASGTLYLTKMLRHPNDYKNVKWFQFETANCNANQTITLSVTVVDRYGNSNTVQVGAPVTNNGIQRVYVPASLPINMARDVKPQVAFATNTSAASPKIVSKIVMAYEPEPMRLD